MSPLIISGPCSAESENQVLSTARFLVEQHVPVLRAGVWKPRTTPGHFEGYGEKALQWLAQAKAETGIKTATEAALPHHVEMCNRYGIDMIWIGARTTASPFAVQQLADAMRGMDTPVMVKNPINPDIHLWTGAIERLIASGVKVVAAVHRGFSVHGNTFYRYPPLWHIAKQLHQQMPDLLMIGDPSHMAGRKELVPTISRQFVRRGYDGYMIECHPMPSTALTDVSQQLDFNALAALLPLLKEVVSTETPDTLSQLRERIDDIDDRLLTLLQERMETVSELGTYKREHDMPASQPERFRSMLRQRLEWCEAHGMNETFVRQLFELIQQESIRRQQQTPDNHQQSDI